MLTILFKLNENCSVEVAVYFTPIMPLDLFTPTLFVYAATLVAEMHATLASHMITPMRLLNPYFTLWTLFELAALYKLQELLVIFVRFDCAPELCTTFTRVEWDHAAETIMFLTGFTFKFTAVRLVKDKSILAVRCRTPTHVC
jgi:hypothetical protein